MYRIYIYTYTPIHIYIYLSWKNWYPRHAQLLGDLPIRFFFAMEATAQLMTYLFKICDLP